MSTSWHRLPGPWWSAGNHQLSKTAFSGLQLWVTTHTREPGVVTLETVKLFGVGTHEAKPSGKRQPVEISDVEFDPRSEEHTSELQSLRHLVCRLLLETKT